VGPRAGLDAVENRVVAQDIPDPLSRSCIMGDAEITVV
jgi:hypothetical protein